MDILNCESAKIFSTGIKYEPNIMLDKEIFLFIYFLKFSEENELVIPISIYNTLKFKYNISEEEYFRDSM